MKLLFKRILERFSFAFLKTILTLMKEEKKKTWKKTFPFLICTWKKVRHRERRILRPFAESIIFGLFREKLATNVFPYASLLFF